MDRIALYLLAQIALSLGAAAAAAAAAAGNAPAPLIIHFDSGSAMVRAEDYGVLDHAARLYRDGNPIVMVVTGATDSAGQPARNLGLSEARARAVLQALVARGIPAGRFQLLAKGETDPAVPGPAGTAQPENRRVEISWR